MMNPWQRWSPAARRARERDMREELDSLAAMAQPGELGNLTLAAENARAAWGWNWLESLAADARYAVRILLGQPGFTLVALISLALGIGANAAIFSLMDAVLWRDLPVREPGRLVRFHHGNSVCYLAYSRYAEQGGRAIEAVFAESGTFQLPLDAGHGPEKGGVYLVTGNYFSSLGVTAPVGRTLAPGDDVRGAPQAALVSYRYWQRAFGGDPAVVGRSLRVAGSRFTVVGVAPPGFLSLTVGEGPDVWLPVSAQPAVFPGEVWQDHSNNNFLTVWGRLRTGVTVAQAEAALTPAEVAIDLERNGSPQGKASREVRPELESAERGGSPLRQFEKPLRVIFCMVAMVLLLACINVMSLEFARADERRRELTVRLAIGAGRARILRQLLTESALLSLAGGAAGLALCRPIGSALASLLTVWGNQPARIDLSIQPGVVAFVLAVSGAAALISGVLPALHATRGDVQPGLQQTARSATPSPVRRVLARSVAGLQMALSLVLVAGTFLFAMSLHQARAFDGGIDRNRLLVLDVDPARAGYQAPAIVELNARLRQRLQAAPGVESASYSQNGIYSGRDFDTLIDADGPHSTAARDRYGRYDHVGPGFFSTLGTRLAAGRDFDERDTAAAPKVAIVSREFARRVFADGAVVGRTLYVTGADRRKTAYRIVGVVQDVRNDIRKPKFLFYLCQPQTGTQAFSTRFLVRTRLPVESVAAGLRAAIAAENAALRIDQIDSADTLLDATLSSERLLAMLAWGFGALALVLAAAGIYGLLAYDVTRRTGEIGIRMAVGARPGDILALVMRQVAVVCALGIAAGAGAALAMAHLVEGLVFGLRSGDPRMEAGAAGVLLAVAFCAAAIPARRAARLDPIAALRHD